MSELRLDEIEEAARAAHTKKPTDEAWLRFCDETEPSVVLAMVREIRRHRHAMQSEAYRAYIGRLLDNQTDHDHAVAIANVRCRICDAEPGAECIYGQSGYPPTGPACPEPARKYPGKAHTRRLVEAIEFQMVSPDAEAARLRDYDTHAEAPSAVAS